MEDKLSLTFGDFVHYTVWESYVTQEEKNTLPYVDCVLLGCERIYNEKNEKDKPKFDISEEAINERFENILFDIECQSNSIAERTFDYIEHRVTQFAYNQAFKFQRLAQKYLTYQQYLYFDIEHFGKHKNYYKYYLSFSDYVGN